MSTDTERAKYEQIWAVDAYRVTSPGAELVPLFLSLAKPHKGASVIDVGAGAGAASRKLTANGLKVTGFDLTDTAWGHDDIPLKVGCLWQDIPLQADYAYCCDVMEHIPTEWVGLSLQNILNAAPECFFSISFEHDTHGAYIQDRLHLTVKPYAWWLETLSEICTAVEARDLMGEGVFYVTR